MGLDDARQMELLRQRLAMNQAQQQGGMGYESARMGNSQFQQSQPSGFERALGGAQGLGQAYLGYRAGQQQGGGYQAKQMTAQNDPGNYMPTGYQNGMMGPQ